MDRHRLDRTGSRMPFRVTPPVTPPVAGSTSDAWALVAPFRSRLIALARARGLSLPDAQDVAHHVMCQAVERGVPDPERVDAYLARAVVQRCQDVRDDEARQEQLLARTRGDDRLAGRVDDAVCDRAQVRWLLGKLPVRERRVVMLSVSGETVTGIAKATGLSYPTVDRLLSRARKEMRRLAGQAGVVGVAVWRHRRVAGPVGATVAAVAVATVTVLTPHTSSLPAEIAVESRERRAATVLHEAAATPVVVARPAARRPASHSVVRFAADGPPRSARRPSLAVPGQPVQVEPAAANPVRRLQDCVRNGVSVEVDSHVGVRCKD